jgi:hypothetical protein
VADDILSQFLVKIAFSEDERSRGGGVDQAYDGWRVVSRFEFQQWVESGSSCCPLPPKLAQSRPIGGEWLIPFVLELI